MKINPYQQFISRNSEELGKVLAMFHKLNHFYNNQFILSLDSDQWEIFDLRISRSIGNFKFKCLKDLFMFMYTLHHDMANSHIENMSYRGQYKLKRTSISSIKRILNLYGFDEYFFTNRKLLNYIIYGELQKENTNSDHN